MSKALFLGLGGMTRAEKEGLAESFSPRRMAKPGSGTAVVCDPSNPAVRDQRTARSEQNNWLGRIDPNKPEGSAGLANYGIRLAAVEPDAGTDGWTSSGVTVVPHVGR